MLKLRYNINSCIIISNYLSCFCITVFVGQFIHACLGFQNKLKLNHISRLCDTSHEMYF